MADATAEAGDPEQVEPGGLVARTPFFYGWLVVGATMLTTMATLPGQTVGVSVFLDGIIDDLGASRSLVSSLYTGATLAGAMVLPIVGRFIDRRGPRLGVAVIGAGLTAACLLMSFVGSVVMLAVAFFGLRSMGQGSLGLVSQHAANLWFVRRRGLALGISVLGFSLGIALVGRLFTAMSDQFGWQVSYRILAVAVLVVVGVAGVGVFRDRPEQYGLAPDGGPARRPARGRAAVSRRTEPEIPAAIARRSGLFWLFTLGTAVPSALGTGLQFHHFSILAEGGLSRSDAALFFAPFGVTAAASTLVAGWLVDRFPHRYVLAAGEAMLAAALWFAPVLTGPGAVYLYGSAIGAMFGITGNVAATVYAHHFGRRHLGEIKGLASTFTIGASALGPLPFALAFDLTGSYLPVLRISALLPVAIIVWALLTRVSRDDARVSQPGPAANPTQHGEERQCEEDRHSDESGPVRAEPVD